MAFWLTPPEISDLDRSTINSGTPGLVLMERAGNAVAEAVFGMVSPGGGVVIVYAGPGNNGGDGFTAARILMEKGYTVIVRPSFGPSGKITDDCRVNMDRFIFNGGRISHEPQGSAAVAVDALLGVGFTGNLRGAPLTSRWSAPAWAARWFRWTFPPGWMALLENATPRR